MHRKGMLSLPCGREKKAKKDRQTAPAVKTAITYSTLPLKMSECSSPSGNCILALSEDITKKEITLDCSSLESSVKGYFHSLLISNIFLFTCFFLQIFLMFHPTQTHLDNRTQFLFLISEINFRFEIHLFKSTSFSDSSLKVFYCKIFFSLIFCFSFLFLFILFYSFLLFFFLFTFSYESQVFLPVHRVSPLCVYIVTHNFNFFNM